MELGNRGFELAKRDGGGWRWVILTGYPPTVVFSSSVDLNPPRCSIAGGKRRLGGGLFGLECGGGAGGAEGSGSREGSGDDGGAARIAPARVPVPPHRRGAGQPLPQAQDHGADQGRDRGDPRD